jgi:hypothetical protein
MILLTQEQAQNTNLLHVSGSDHLMCTDSSLFVNGQDIHLQSFDPGQSLAILPDLPLLGSPGQSDGLWMRHRFNQPEKHPLLNLSQSQQAEGRQSMALGPYIDWRKTAVPIVPPDSAFHEAAKWQLHWTNRDMSGLSDALLQIDYTGDIGRFEADGKLLDDNFYNGTPWQLSLRRLGVGRRFTLELLPMPNVAPIYLDTLARNHLKLGPRNPNLIRITIRPVYEAVATPQR